MIETVPAGLDGERIDRVVALLTGCSRSEAAALVAAGAVRVGTGGVAPAVVTARAGRVVEGDEVAVDVPEAAGPTVVAEDGIELSIVHEDGDVIVVDKPTGLVVHPGAGHRGGTMVHGLLARYPEMAGVGEPGRPGVVHRLDKETSGLLVVARTEAARVALVAALSAHDVTREYLALVHGIPSAAAGMVDAPIGRSTRSPTRMAVSTTGREARTRYEVVQRWPAVGDHGTALLRCRLETGRTHQIRVHLTAIGHPVAGDRTYGGDRPVPAVPRLFLHAARLAFAHPRTGEPVAFESPLPADLADALTAFGRELSR